MPRETVRGIHRYKWHINCLPQPIMSEPKGTLLRKSVHGLYIGAAMFLGVIVAGATAYHLAGWSLSDAVYMVVITVFSVGYEEVQPSARLRCVF